MSIKALDVANYILWLENRFEGSEGITPLKLQKLVLLSGLSFGNV